MSWGSSGSNKISLGPPYPTALCPAGGQHSGSLTVAWGFAADKTNALFSFQEPPMKYGPATSALTAEACSFRDKARFLNYKFLVLLQSADAL
jgi:hypothetical protein